MSKTIARIALDNLFCVVEERSFISAAVTTNCVTLGILLKRSRVAALRKGIISWIVAVFSSASSSILSSCPILDFDDNGDDDDNVDYDDDRDHDDRKDDDGDDDDDRNDAATGTEESVADGDGARCEAKRKFDKSYSSIAIQ